MSRQKIKTKPNKITDKHMTTATSYRDIIIELKEARIQIEIWKQIAATLEDANNKLSKYFNETKDKNEMEK